MLILKIRHSLSNLIRSVTLGLGFLGFIHAVSATEHPRPEKPNIVLVYTDDLGWQDVGCYDIDEPSPYETPNIDALARKGVQFWQGYSPAPTCAPSRCAIMSGVHPARAQKTHVRGGLPPKPINQHLTMIDPWYRGGMPADEFTLANALKKEGYTTGHSGKWHIASDHKAFPQPTDVGFDYSQTSRGARSGMKNRLKGFATKDTKDPFKLDENGFPFHQTNEDALTFLRENKQQPFFLYYATWLVHAPIHTRSEALLDKYVQRMGIAPKNTYTKDTPGQQNPFYGAMVEELDYYVGTIFKYLETTEDPRWPGHMLSENTYIIFSSDNGGMEGDPKERYTDNNPLDRGKISAKEGGTRVPFIIVGPKIPAGVQTDVMANGLDFYPTILSMVGAQKPADKQLDGLDLFPLLTQDPNDPSRVKHPDGSTRDTMMWHFPHGHAMESTIRIGDYKLIRNYDSLMKPAVEPFELYQLYDSTSGTQKRVDIEESKNLAQQMPEKTQMMDQLLTQMLTEMDASYPYYSPHTTTNLPKKANIPTVTSTTQTGKTVTATYKTNGAAVIQADLIYTQNGGDKYEEWHRTPAKILPNGIIEATLPSGTTHYVFNLIDENNFLVSHPDFFGGHYNKKHLYSTDALSVSK